MKGRWQPGDGCPQKIFSTEHVRKSSTFSQARRVKSYLGRMTTGPGPGDAVQPQWAALLGGLMLADRVPPDAEVVVGIECGPDALRAVLRPGGFEMRRGTAPDADVTLTGPAELARRLRPGARLAVFEVCRTDDGEPSLPLPLPWSLDGGDSHLATADAIVDRPWLSAYFMRNTDAQSKSIRLYERLGEQTLRLDLDARQRFHAVSAIIGVVVGSAVDLSQEPPQEVLDGAVSRDQFLNRAAESWRELDPEEYPFVHEIDGHDDADQFRSALELTLAGLRLQAGA